MKKIIPIIALAVLFAACSRSHGPVNNLTIGPMNNPDQQEGGLIDCTANPDGTLPAGCK